MDKNYSDSICNLSISSRQLDTLKSILEDIRKRLCEILDGDKINPILEDFRELEWKVKQFEELKSMKKKIDSLLSTLSK